MKTIKNLKNLAIYLSLSCLIITASLLTSCENDESSTDPVTSDPITKKKEDVTKKKEAVPIAFESGVTTNTTYALGNTILSNAKFTIPTASAEGYTIGYAIEEVKVSDATTSNIAITNNATHSY